MIRLRREGLGYFKIACYLNDRGIPSRHGCNWHTATVQAVLRRFVPELCPRRADLSVPQEFAAAHARDLKRQHMRRAYERSEAVA